MNEDFDVAIVGAGPAGSGAAAALASRGWRVLLVERDRLPRHKVCGEFLSPESQATLATLGLGGALAAASPVPLVDAELISRRGTRLLTALPGAAWGLSRYAMDAALAAAAAANGATLWQGHTVTDLQRSDTGVLLTIRGDGMTKEVRARTGLMAGGRGVAAKLLAQPLESRPARLNLGVKAHFADVVMPNRVEVYLFEGGYVGINPVETGAANVCLLASYDAFAQADRNPAAIFAAIARQNDAFGVRMFGARLVEETLCTVGAVDTGRPSRPWNGVACLGDTATMIPPLCGDGMAMALHSAALCVPYADAFLRDEIDLYGWQRGYSHSWHAAFDGRLRTGRTLQAMLNSRVADVLLRAGSVVPPAADYFVRATRGTTDSPMPASANG